MQSERTGTGAELPHLVGTGGIQRLGQLARQGLTEQGRHLWCGDKIAARAHDCALGIAQPLWQVAKLGRAVGVVAKPRGVERSRHEVIKSEPTRVLADTRLNEQGEFGANSLRRIGWDGGR